MIKYELAENNKSISIENTEIDKRMTYSLGGSISILNKFNFIIDLSENISNTEGVGKDYNNWLWQILKDYGKAYDDDIVMMNGKSSEELDSLTPNNNRFKLLQDNIPKIKEFVDKFYTIIDMDFTQFTDFKNMVKGAILFDENDIKTILYVSSYMKIYCLISYSTKKALGLDAHRKIYNNIISDFVGKDIIEKIYNVVKTKTYKYNMTDKPMWEYLKNFQGKSIDSHIGETFNFLLNNILVFCEYNKNPITFMVFVINNNSRWVLHSIYVHNIQYEGQLSTEDIHTITSDNLKTYAYNEVLGQIKTLAYHKVSSEIMLTEQSQIDGVISEAISEEIVETNKRIDSITLHAPIHHCLTFPLISQICDIPYYHMKTIDANHACVISMYLHELLKSVFPEDKFKNFFDILDYGILKEPSVSTTFRIKYGDLFINKANKYKFYSFKSKTLLHKLICHFIGIISRCKDGYLNLKTGEIKDGFQINNLELEMIDFFVYYCADKFDGEIEKMKKLLYASL